MSDDERSKNTVEVAERLADSITTVEERDFNLTAAKAATITDAIVAAFAALPVKEGLA